jgi:hypothetical protein
VQGWQRKSRKQFHRPALDADAAPADEPFVLARQVRPVPVPPPFAGRVRRRQPMTSSSGSLLLQLQHHGLFVGML